MALERESIDHFHGHGFTIIRNFLPEPTAQQLRRMAGEDDVLAAHAYLKKDASGRQSKVTLWYEPGDDVFGRLSCSDAMQDAMSGFLGGEACFFHAKLMQKEPAEGGAWEWHQDYGYWYDDGFLSDAMGSCYVAFDPAVKENGCLQIIPGSHLYGRLRHGVAGEQRGADAERVDVLKQRLGVHYCELAAGDALFFHANLLHASGPNTSEQSRWGMISCFYRDDNQSISDDKRFVRKQTPRIAHDRIMKGAAASSDTEKSFLQF